MIRIINKNLEEITEEDIKELLNKEAYKEGKSIDYKESFDLRKESDKKEFCYDVCSFANSDGGFLIFGIKEIEGIPTEICGTELFNDNRDETKLQITNLLKSTVVEPQINIDKIKIIKISNNKNIIIISIPKSWYPPHKSYDRFYGRTSAGKYLMDIATLRNIFGFSEYVKTKIINFQMNRVNKIIMNNSYLPLIAGAKVVLHCIPLNVFDNKDKSYSENLKNLYNRGLPSIGNYPDEIRFNFDGLLTTNMTNKKAVSWYTQCFRNGAIEIVSSKGINNEKKKLFPSAIHESLYDNISNIQKILFENFRIDCPFLIFITIINIEGMSVSYPYFMSSFQPSLINKKVLSFDCLFIESSQDKLWKKELYRFIEQLWQAFGFSETPEDCKFCEK